MLGIIIEGNRLYIPEDTNIELEQHNAVFDLDNIMSDIIWTFTLPAKPNAEAFDNAHFVCMSNHKGYSCEVTFDGVTLANGVLMVQATKDEDYLNCGMTLNVFSSGFGKKMLREDDYGPDRIIADSIDSHQSGWTAFLKESLVFGSVFKFFLFKDDIFYRQNDGYGYHCNAISPLMNSDRQDLEHKFINRLFYRSVNNEYVVVNIPDRAGGTLIRLGTRLFNTVGNSNLEKINGYAFAPALQLHWMIQKVFATTGMSVVGNFMDDERIGKLYVQSMNAMDADRTQYPIESYINISGDIDCDNVVPTSFDDYSTFENGDEIRSRLVKRGGVAVSFRFLLDESALQRNVTVTPTQLEPMQLYDEVYAIGIFEDTQQGYVRRSKAGSDTADFLYGGSLTESFLITTFGEDAYLKWLDGHDAGSSIEFDWAGLARLLYPSGSSLVYTDWKPILDPAGKKIFITQITGSKSHPYPGYVDPEMGSVLTGGFVPDIFNIHYDNGKSYYIKIVKCRVYSCKNNGGPIDTGIRWDIPQYGMYELLNNFEAVDSIELTNQSGALNIFQNVMRWRDHVPSVSNAEFITAVCKFFGLSMYVDSFRRIVQLQFFADEQKAKALDISRYIVSSERVTFEPTGYNLRVESVLGTRRVSGKFLMDPVESKDDIPLPAARYKDKSIFVANENAYRRSTLDEGRTKYVWTHSGGNDIENEAGSEDGDSSKDVSSRIKVPCMKLIDEGVNQNYIEEIESEGCSCMFDEDYTGDFDIILQQYRGRRPVRVPGYGVLETAFIEDANPTWYNEDGTHNSNAINLTATGEQSVGEMWQKPLYDFLGNRENYRFVAIVPTAVFLQLRRLNMPQEDDPGDQVRYIFVNGRRYLPSMISFEFGTGNTGQIKTTIECSRQHIEV